MLLPLSNKSRPIPKREGNTHSQGSMLLILALLGYRRERERERERGGKEPPSLSPARSTQGCVSGIFGSACLRKERDTPSYLATRDTVLAHGSISPTA